MYSVIWVYVQYKLGLCTVWWWWGWDYWSDCSGFTVWNYTRGNKVTGLHYLFRGINHIFNSPPPHPFDFWINCYMVQKWCFWFVFRIFPSRNYVIFTNFLRFEQFIYISKVNSKQPPPCLVSAQHQTILPESCLRWLTIHIFGEF